jgi:hypothetical protein
LDEDMLARAVGYVSSERKTNANEQFGRRGREVT